MIIQLLLMAAGLGLLTFGADWLVQGAGTLARRLNISALVIGLTVVAFGTSAPELVVSLQAAWQNSADVAIGNVIGSNISNILLVLGVAALLRPVPVHKGLFRLDIPALLGSSVLLMAVFADTTLTRPDSLLLLAGTVLFFWIRISCNQKISAPPLVSVEQHLPRDTSLPKSILLTLTGLAMLLIGANLLIDSALEVAGFMGWDEGITGLLLIAIGTSLPELAASVAASLRRESDMLVGGIVGSNIFNTLIIPGISFLLFPGSAPTIDFANLWIMLGAGALLIPLMLTGAHLNRTEGGILVLCYLGYVWFLL